ncbi:MAG TPA: hypothetical protein PKA88_36115 [Polyangiaceae bacterium]|nr:hypothetical protein [Polyangiaceae bacterium]HMR79466.1 hypothetical protein [Polyangiaceae bacterium]
MEKTRGFALILACLTGGACERPTEQRQTSPTDPPQQTGPCQPGPAGPPVTRDHPLAKAFANCEQACWELEYLAPAGGGMPASAELVSCVMAPSQKSVRCVVQHLRVCREPNTPY